MTESDVSPHVDDPFLQDRSKTRLLLPSIATAVVVLLLCLPSHAEKRPSKNRGTKVQSLIDNIVKAYGGKDIIEGTGSVSAEGRITAVMLRDKGTYVRHFKRDRKLWVRTKYARSSELRILNGSRGFRGTNASLPSEVTGYRYLAMVYQYKYLDLPYGLLNGLYRVDYEGKEELNGSLVEVLALNDTEGPPMKAYIDSETFLIRKVEGYFVIEERNADLAAEFSDFRQVHGTVFPFMMTNYGSGQKISETTFQEYRVNEPIEDPLFEPPSETKR